MHIYRKKIHPKNTAAKISALLFLLSGAFLLTVAKITNVAPALFQLVAICFITASIYIASAYLLREYTFELANNFKKDAIHTSEMYDFIIMEQKGKRSVKVCHLEMSDVTEINEITPTNAKQINAARKNKKKYTYNTQFAASRKIEVCAEINGDQLSIIVTYDEELLRTMKAIFDNSLHI